MNLTDARGTIVKEITHGLSAQRPLFGYAFIFLDNAFHFLEDAPVALVSFVLWDSVRAPRERSLRFES